MPIVNPLLCDIGNTRNHWRLEGARNAARAWHTLHRLGGHCSPEITDGVLRSGKFGKLSMPDEMDEYCGICQRAKFARPPVPKKSHNEP